MNKIILTLALILTLTGMARAQTYPTCQSGATAGAATSCTMTIHVTSAITPIYARLSSRQYLFLQNTGYTFSSGLPVINQNPVFCAINSGNNPVANSAASSNVIVIQPGGVYEPPQIVKPQNAFTVPSGDISCIAPLGDVWLSVEVE